MEHLLSIPSLSWKFATNTLAYFPGIGMSQNKKDLFIDLGVFLLLFPGCSKVIGLEPMILGSLVHSSTSCIGVYDREG